MITSFPFRMADAAARAEGTVDQFLIRLIVKFDQVSNAGDDGCPRWVRDGDTYVQAATFERAPSYRKLEAAIEASFKVFPKDGRDVRYTYLSCVLVCISPACWCRATSSAPTSSSRSIMPAGSRSITGIRASTSA
jgi:hypothetical protein